MNTKKKLLEKRLEYFKDEVNPRDVIPLLKCLTIEDKQEIECQQNLHGAIRALGTLVDRLRRRDNGFEQFVVALRQQSLDHVAQLLDPLELVDQSDALNEAIIDNGKFQIIGTVVGNHSITSVSVYLIDVEVNGQITCTSNQGNERNLEFEKMVAEEYKSTTYEHSCKIRKMFKKEMPQGIEFVRTKQNAHDINKTAENAKEKQEENKDKDTSEEASTSNESNSNDIDADAEEVDWDDSFKVVFRLTSSEVAKKFWDMYMNHELEAKITKIVVCGALQQTNGTLDEVGDLKLNLKIVEEDFQEIVDFFERSNGPSELLNEMDIKIPEVLLESHRSSVQNRTLQLREYQKELANPAINGRNTIICAPTNSGKTFVAMEIARLHLEKYGKDSAGETEQQSKLPQIVGLTASLGVGRSNESEKAQNHILQISANMDAWCISTVQDNVDELEKNLSEGVPRRKLEKVDQVANVFEKVIVQVMGKIEKAAQNFSANPIGAPADRVGQQYRQWVESLENDAVAKGGMRDVITYAKHLRRTRPHKCSRYHIALLINDTVRIKDALKYLEECFEQLDQTKFQHSDKKLQDLYEKARDGIKGRIEKAEPTNPKLEKLKELVLKFHEEDENKERSNKTKGILFTRTRDSTMGLKGWIEETPELQAILRPKILVGAGNGEVGMTQGEQEAIIEEFKKSEVNILIATTVAEEGLDIGDCNFVIRYNMAGNEISSVQSRGRIRADDGNYVYLGDSRTKGVNRERLNQYREILMTTAVAEVQQICHEDYLTKEPPDETGACISHTIIKDIQLKDVRKLQMKNFLNTKKIRSKLQIDDVKFFCRQCNAVACQLDDFRRLKDNYHVILNKEFKLKINVKPRKNSKKVDDILIESKDADCMYPPTQVHCIHCDEDWGVTVKIDGLTWPCLKVRSFVIEDKGQRRTYKKWSEFPYEIPEAGLSEIIEMDDSLDNDDLDLDV
ncbi:hypothetical protein QZH41_010147 [Actinostola sp. cb2023]|nr:hypothetical protein QZH41_010147 [Actinostola sp. cb2023]